MKDDNSITPFILIVIFAIFGLGYIIGFTTGEQFTQKETINFCIEKPDECKTKYDYFKLEEKNEPNTSIYYLFPI